ncbi:MAG: prepilin-type N-terminal cleavage/methylation domain-containing protein [Terriglobales bacterium]
MRVSGFTLLELSIVLVIIAIVTGMAVSAGMSVVATARISATQKKMEAIDQALMQYRTANNRLPCPGDLTLAPGGTDYGLEAGADGGSAIAIGTGACTGTGMLPQANFTGNGATNTLQQAAEGALPAITLGLSPDFMVDGWGNKLRYVVDTSMTANNAFPYTPVGCNDGAITVNDSNGNPRSSNSIYALISHGPNAHGAYPKSGGTTLINTGSVNINEQTNCHCNSSGAQAPASGAPAYAPTYVQMLPTIDPTNNLDNFDDIVSYKERWQMQTPWDSTGVCQYIYISDYDNGVIDQFNMQGQFMQSISSPGNSDGQLRGPSGLKLDASGNIYVADKSNCRVQKLSPNGTFILGIGAGYQGIPGNKADCTVSYSGAGTFHIPAGIALDSSGNIYVTDTANYRIQKFNSSGTYQWMSGGGTAPTGSTTTCYACTYPNSPNTQGNCSANVLATACINNGAEFCVCTQGSGPPPNFTGLNHGIAVCNNGTNLCVADSGGSVSQVQTFNLNGPTTATSYFTVPTQPSGMVVDASGTLYVTSDIDHEVLKYASVANGTTGSAFINNGHCAPPCSPPNGGKLSYPLDIAIDNLGYFYVLDSVNPGTFSQVDKFNSIGGYIGSFGYSTLGATHTGGIAIGR